MRSRTWIIYALIDPRDGNVRYIGLTEYPDARLKQHIQGDGNIPKRKWVSELNRLGLSPIMRTIETVHSLTEAFEREGYWIRYSANRGASLVNIHPPYRIRDVGAKLSSNASSISEMKGNAVTLDDLIAEAGLKRVELAAQSGISTASIVRICQGAPTSKITVIKLLKVLRKYLNRKINIEDIDGLNITK